LVLVTVATVLGAKTVICISTTDNNFDNNSEHSNALLVVVVVFLVQTQYAVIDPGTSTLNT